MIQSAKLRALLNGSQGMCCHVSHQLGTGRRANLVVYDPKMIAFERQLQHGLGKILAACGIDPTAAKDQMLRATGDGQLALQFGFPINTQGTGDIAFLPGLFTAPIEYIVGRVVHQPGTQFLRFVGKYAGCKSVDPLRQFRLELGLVDSRISRSVDDNVGFQTPNRAGQAGPIELLLAVGADMEIARLDGLTGATIVCVNRRGKYLLCPLDTGEELMMHLRMSGRLLVAAAGTPRPAHTHVVMHLAGEPAQELWFVDPRTFGEVVVFDPVNVAVELPELAKMGVDPIADGLSRAQFAGLLRSRSRQIKALLLDQHVIAGIGNIYCDESLHLAGVRWDRPSDAVTPREITRLHAAIMSVLGEAIEAGGSTLADTQYVGLDGEAGWFQLHHRVYDRAGQRCLTCGKADIVKVAVAGRGTHFCPRCQK